MTINHLHFRFLIIVSTIIFLTTTCLSQVNSLSYYLTYDNNKSTVDCHMIINEGQATSLIERVQLSAQYSLVAPNGTDIHISEDFMPLQNNQTYNGTTPTKWAIGTIVKTPETTPHKDYYSIVPSMTPTSSYNNLSKGDTIKLFRIQVTNGCPRDIKLFHNDNDPSSDQIGMQYADFSQGFTMGGRLNQLYLNNIEPNTSLDISIPLADLCVGTHLQLPSDKKGIWISNNKNIAEVTNSGMILPVSAGSVNFEYKYENADCSMTSSNLSIKSTPEVSMDKTEICIHTSFQLFTPSEGSWSSNNPSVASIEQHTGLVTSLNAGETSFILKSNVSGCSSSPTSDLIVLDENDINCSINSNNDLSVENIKVYPNPAFGYFILEGINSNATIKIYDQTGRLVYSVIKDFSVNNKTNVNTMNSGLYLVQINQDNTILHKKLTIIRG